MLSALKNATQSVLHHVDIARQLARVGIVRKSQLQLEFWSQVIMDCLWYASHVAVFEVLYSHTQDIAGWRRDDFRVLLGFLFVSDAFMMIWLGQMWRFGRELKDGKLDPCRVRPASAFFLFAFQQFSLEGCVNMAVALCYLVYAVCIAAPLTLGTLFITLGALLLCFWARTIVITFFSLFELYMLGSDATRFLHELFHAASDRPVDIFGARVRLLLLYIVPVGALTQIPASLVLGRLSAWQAIGTVSWLFALGVLIFAAWNRGFRRYESAMS